MNFVEQSQIPELDNIKMSNGLMEYQVSDVRQRKPAEPLASYGLQATRYLDAPPTSLVDNESLLMNRYDVIGRSGYVYSSNGKTPVLNEFVTPDMPAGGGETPAKFLDPVASRDAHLGCNPLNYYRMDVGVPKTPYIPQYQVVNTRRIAKDTAADCQEQVMESTAAQLK